MTMLTGTSAPPGANGRKQLPPTGLARRPRVRTPYLGLGVLLVVLGALTFGLWSSQSTTRRTVLEATRDIPAGDVIAASDLREVQVSADSGTSLVLSTQKTTIVGRRAAVTIPSGSLLASASVRDGAQLAHGEAIVSVILAPGAAPVPDLRVGDRVAVVAAATGKSGSAGTPGVLATGDVIAVTPIRQGSAPSGSVSVSLKVPAQAAAAIADAASAGRVALVLVAPGDDLSSTAGG